MNTILTTYNGIDIRKDEHGFVCLNDLWYVAGRPANKKPKDWKRLVSVVELINHLQKQIGVGKSHPEETGAGKNRPEVIYSITSGNAATFAVRELALAYAGYLDVALRAFIYQVFAQHIDGGESALELPKRGEVVFAGSTRRKSKPKQLSAGQDNDVAYWKGYAEAMKEAVLLVAGKGVR